MLPKQIPVGILIGAARRRIKQSIAARVKHYGLTPQQFWVFVAVHERQPTTLNALAQAQHMDQPTASRIVTTLVQKNLVEMSRDPSDRRKICVVISAPGHDLARTLAHLATEFRQQIVAGIDDAEQETLRTLLQRIMVNLERFEGRRE